MSKLPQPVPSHGEKSGTNILEPGSKVQEKETREISTSLRDSQESSENDEDSNEDDVMVTTPKINEVQGDTRSQTSQAVAKTALSKAPGLPQLAIAAAASAAASHSAESVSVLYHYFKVSSP